MAQSSGAAVLHLNGVKELGNLLGYLHLKNLTIDKKTSVGLNEGPVFKEGDVSVSGFTTVAKTLVSHSEHKESLLGNDPLERAYVTQWVDYSQCLSCADNVQLKAYCKELNSYLSDKTFFVSDRLTLADIILYSFLHKVIEKSPSYEREEFMNLSRWCDQVKLFVLDKDSSPNYGPTHSARAPETSSVVVPPHSFVYLNVNKQLV